jgi:uncharacterized protein YcbX
VLLGTVREIRRYPVKSMGGEVLESAHVQDRALAGDRAYAVFDAVERKVGSAKNVAGFPRLLDFRARYVADVEPGTLPPIEITLPDGRRVRSDDVTCEKLLSSWFGRRVGLGCITEDDSVRPASGKYAMPGMFQDYAALHLLTDVALASLAASAPESRVEIDRFRPNLVIASSAAGGYPENDWTGRHLRIGAEIVVEVTDPCPRCAMTTLAQGELPKDPAVLKAIAQANTVLAPVLEGDQPCLGSYAFVRHGGMVRAGDPVRME